MKTEPMLTVTKATDLALLFGVKEATIAPAPNVAPYSAEDERADREALERYRRGGR